METWKYINGLEYAYQVSDLGRIRSLDRIVYNRSGIASFRRGKIIKQFIDKRGYYQVLLPNKKCKQLVHRIVATAFIPNPDNLPEVNHIHGIKTDNRPSELEWSDRSRQMIHAYATGLREKYCHANRRWLNRKIA